MKKLLLIVASLILIMQTSFAQTKKDGTPDKRYKANKEAAAKPVEGPKKKDGTPDMRHKANKEAAKKDAATKTKK
jgi:hypothetical protein